MVSVLQNGQQSKPTQIRGWNPSRGCSSLGPPLLEHLHQDPPAQKVHSCPCGPASSSSWPACQDTALFPVSLQGICLWGQRRGVGDCRGPKPRDPQYYLTWRHLLPNSGWTDGSRGVWLAERGGDEGIWDRTGHSACLRFSAKCCVRTLLSALHVRSWCVGTVPREQPPELPMWPHCYPCPRVKGRGSEMLSNPLNMVERAPNPHPASATRTAFNYSAGLDGVPQTPVLPGAMTLFGSRLIADVIR